jgi:HD-GYP domain-containing protein (c-di-GMP phosphodiesterase class II)
MIESHHEWYNGKGYPRKLRGEDIPLGARIIAVADAYDAMTSPRPYRSSLSNEDAIKTLRKGAGKQWDPVVVDAFIQTLKRESRMLASDVIQKQLILGEYSDSGSNACMASVANGDPRSFQRSAHH